VAVENSDKLESAVVAAVDEVCARDQLKRWLNGQWTWQVKAALAEVGKLYCSESYSSGCDKVTGGEWLFDMTWLEYDKSGRLVRIPAVFEFEWDSRGLQDDFQKLVLARAEHRIFLFEPAKGRRVNEVVNDLYKHVLSCDQSRQGDRYLFGAWQESDWRFKWDLKVVPAGGGAVYTDAPAEAASVARRRKV
jgi:hypothetical protein